MFGDIPIFNATNVYQSTFSPEGVLNQMVQNFFNFFSNTMFWLSYIPVYEKFRPLFETEDSNVTDETDESNVTDEPAESNVTEETGESNETDETNETNSLNEEAGAARFADVPQFNTSYIYFNVYSPSGVAIQLVQNFFNWLTSTMYWLSYTPFYERLLPLFSPANNQRNVESIFNPMQYFKYWLISDTDMENENFEDQWEPRTRVRSPFKFIEHLKELFFGEDLLEEDGDDRFFGDPWTFNMTTVYQSTYSPDGILIQMVQNFFNFLVSTMFWLSYLPFYERLFPIFNDQFNTTEENNLSFKFSLDSLEKKYVSSPRNFKSSGKVFELSFGKFSKLLNAFADIFERIQR